MTGCVLGSPNNTGSVSGYSRGQYVRNCLCEVEDDYEEEIEENSPLSTQGGHNSPRVKPKMPSSVRRPLGPPGPGSSVSSRVPEGIATLMPPDSLASIQNLRKHKGHTEVFSAFTDWPRGNDPNHI